MKSTNHFRVVIIGAGPAGIGAAIALSKQGITTVALIERSDNIGGVPYLYKKNGRAFGSPRDRKRLFRRMSPPAKSIYPRQLRPWASSPLSC